MADIASLLPQFFPSFWREDYGMFGIDFAAGVSLGFVLRSPGGYAYLLVPEFAAMKLDSQEILSRALSNLAQLGGASLKIACPDNTTVAWIVAEDNFCSVRMLLPDVRARLLEALGPGFHFTLASRDACFFWSRSAAGASHDKFKAEAQEDFQSEQYNLSPETFVFSDAWPCLIAAHPLPTLGSDLAEV